MKVMSLALALACVGSLWVVDGVGQAQPIPTADVQDDFLPWPLPPGAEDYADIDGRRMHRYVVEQAEIARRYRDAVHPKFWGRIIGTSADAESASWLADKFRTIGLSNVRIQSFELVPQWFPGEYEVTARSGSTTLELASAQPFYRSEGTPASGLDLEAVYVGLGREADYLGRDVRGKAVFLYSMLGLPDIWQEETIRRAADKGAAAIFNVHMLPGSMRYQEYPRPTGGAPGFTVGGDEGFEVERLIAAAPSGQPVRVSVRLETRLVPDLETAIVWGTLPGASDETIFLIAHRDGWFDASGDNSSGVASIIGLAEHYAKIPEAERPRTIVFLGIDGHHNSGEGSAVGQRWLSENRAEIFAKTALMINAEHPSTVLTMLRPRYTDLSGVENENQMFWTTAYTPQQWYAGGPSRPELQRIAVHAFREFGVTTFIDPLPEPPAGDLGRHYRYVPGVATSDFHHYFHTDLETPETVPWTGLEATTRAYARIIDEVNKRPLSVWKRPEEPGNP
ncbi:MAG TPA: M28 family peptidase [Vicinamibacteria bacterium]|nr:M28 family peptidase [Vicinamibacteria bacterium]